MQILDQSIVTSDYQRLLKAITEELKLPLLQIAQKAELGSMINKPQMALDYLSMIEQNATSALKLIDSYLLGLELSSGQQELALEPLSLGSVLTEAAHQLYMNAKQYNVEINLEVSNKQPLVMGNPAALQSAYTSLGMTFLTEQPAGKKKSVIFAAFPSKKGVSLGVFGDNNLISQKEWVLGRDLSGKTGQPLLAFGGGHTAGIFVADSILRAMSARLLPTKRHNRYGFSASFQLSKQLQFL